MPDFATFTSAVAPVDRLIAGPEPLGTRLITIAAGAAYVRGAVLGKITASGKYILSASAAADGSQTPDVVLAHDADATSADVEALAYDRADVNEAALTIGTGHTVASIKEGLRVKGIRLVPVQA